MFNSLQPHGLQPIRFLCPWGFPGKNTGVGSHSLLQGIFPMQGSNPGSCTPGRFFTVWASLKPVQSQSREAGVFLSTVWIWQDSKNLQGFSFVFYSFVVCLFVYLVLLLICGIFSSRNQGSYPCPVKEKLRIWNIRLPEKSQFCFQ